MIITIYDIDKIVQDIKVELEKSNKKFDGDFHSTHEWYGVLKEEVDELWEEIKTHKYTYATTKTMKEEAIQVAAMAIKGILSLPHTKEISMKRDIEHRQKGT